MPKISSKKKKFIQRNARNLSIEEIAAKTGLKPTVIRSILKHAGTEKSVENNYDNPNKGSGNNLFWKTTLIILLLFSTVSFIIYFPCLNGEFVFDDNQAIKDNIQIHITKLSQLLDILCFQEIDRRFGYISFALNFYLGGVNPFGYHLVNVIIHILCGFVLFLLSNAILSLPANKEIVKNNTLTISFLGSLLWLVHPIQTQAVSYIVQRVTSLSALFFLLSLLCYIKGRGYQDPRRIPAFLFSAVFCLLALGTKQNAATLPLFVILTEIVFFQKKPFKIDRIKAGFIILLGVLFIFIAVVYLGPDIIAKVSHTYKKWGWTPVERVLTQFRVVIFYLTLIIYPNPSRLTIDHDFPVSHSLFSPFSTFLSLLLILVSLGFAFWSLKKTPLIFYAILWYFGNLVIESSIIPLEMVFEHRMYLPSMGLILLIVALPIVLNKPKWKMWISVCTIPPILLFSYWTFERSCVWQGAISVWRDAAQKATNKSRPLYNLGNAYWKKGRVDDAILAYERAIAISPYYPKSHYNLGIAYAKKGRLDDAISEYQQTIAINPNHAEAHTNLGLIYDNTGKLEKAITKYNEALNINPNLQEAHYNLAIVYIKQTRFDKAIPALQKVIALKPDYAKAHLNLGFCYYKQGNYKLALTHYSKAQKLGSKVDEKLLEELKKG